MDVILFYVLCRENDFIFILQKRIEKRERKVLKKEKNIIEYIQKKSPDIFKKKKKEIFFLI